MNAWLIWYGKKIGRVTSYDNLRKSIEFSQEIATMKNHLNSFGDSFHVTIPIEMTIGRQIKNLSYMKVQQTLLQH